MDNRERAEFIHQAIASGDVSDSSNWGIICNALDEAEARGRVAEHERMKWILEHECLTGDCSHDREVECFNAIYDCLHEEFGEQKKSPLGERG